MTTTPRLRLQRDLLRMVLLGFALTLCAGCQTFSLSEEDFHRQQHGEMADQQTGQAVEAVGTVGYLGAIIGEAVAAALGK